MNSFHNIELLKKKKMFEENMFTKSLFLENRNIFTEVFFLIFQTFLKKILSKFKKELIIVKRENKDVLSVFVFSVVVGKV